MVQASFSDEQQITQRVRIMLEDLASQEPCLEGEPEIQREGRKVMFNHPTARHILKAIKAGPLTTTPLHDAVAKSEAIVTQLMRSREDIVSATELVAQTARKLKKTQPQSESYQTIRRLNQDLLSLQDKLGMMATDFSGGVVTVLSHLQKIKDPKPAAKTGLFVNRITPNPMGINDTLKDTLSTLNYFHVRLGEIIGIWKKTMAHEQKITRMGTVQYIASIDMPPDYLHSKSFLGEGIDKMKGVFDLIDRETYGLYLCVLREQALQDMKEAKKDLPPH